MQPSKHSVPGQYLGYALQPVRMCYHLLTCPLGASVSLEYLDDIAIHLPNGEVILEQSKSALKQNPLSDWSEDLWKTIANWLELLKNTDFDVQKSEFQIYVTPPKEMKLAGDLHKASKITDIAKIKDEIKKKLKKSKKPTGCIKFLQFFLDATEEDSLAVISRIKIINENNDPLDPIRKLLEPTIPTAAIDNYCQTAIGMAKEGADSLIRKGMPAIINGDSFKLAFKAFVQKNNLPNLLIPLSKTPQPSSVQSFLSARPVFIRQLEFIEASDEQRIRAVSDYLRSSADKSLWAEAGTIVEQSLNDWDNYLINQHQFISDEISDTNSDKSAKVRGRITYNRCSQLNLPLDGRAVPGHFVHGCFNALADEKRLGWHPNYIKLLEGDDK